MSYSLIFSPFAIEDLSEISSWFESRPNNSKEKFIADMSKISNRLKSMPETFPYERKPLRKALLKKFPYKVLYFINEPKLEIRLVAVVHQSRDPDYWKKRL